MSKSKVDAVITLLELDIENLEDGEIHRVVHEFIDYTPNFPIVDKTIRFINKNRELNVLDHKYSFERINKNTSLRGLERTLH